MVIDYDIMVDKFNKLLSRRVPRLYCTRTLKSRYLVVTPKESEWGKRNLNSEKEVDRVTNSSWSKGGPNIIRAIREVLLVFLKS